MIENYKKFVVLLFNNYKNLVFIKIVYQWKKHLYYNTEEN